MSLIKNKNNNQNSAIKKSKGLFGLPKRKTDENQDYFKKNKENKENIKNFNDSVKTEKQKKEDLLSSSASTPPLTPSDSKKETIKKFKKWTSSNVLQTNLIKDEVVVYIDWHKNIIISLVYLFILLTLVSGAYYGVNYTAKRANIEGQQLSKETQELNQKLKEVKASIAEVDIFRRRIGIVKVYLDKHIYWTNFFKEIEDNTLKDVYYGSVASFSGDIDNNNYNFSVKASDYKDIPNQLRVLRRGKYISDVGATGGILEQFKEDDGTVSSSVKFDVEFTVDDGVFYKNDNDSVDADNQEALIEEDSELNNKEVKMGDISWK